MLFENDVCVIRNYFIVGSKIARQSPKVHKIEKLSGRDNFFALDELFAYIGCIIPGQLGDKQSTSYVVPGLRMHKILRGTNFYVLPLFDRYVE